MFFVRTFEIKIWDIEIGFYACIYFERQTLKQIPVHIAYIVL